MPRRPKNPLPEHLAALVREGHLTLAEARAAAEAGRVERRNAARRDREAAERMAKRAAWQEEERRMSPTWALFVQAHIPAYGDLVIHKDYPLREAVARVKELTGCDLDCEHRPLTADQVAAFWAAIAKLP
jgi:hypothetical protein